jgi:hypothetical protein
LDQPKGVVTCKGETFPETLDNEMTVGKERRSSWTERRGASHFTMQGCGNWMLTDAQRLTGLLWFEAGLNRPRRWCCTHVTSVSANRLGTCFAMRPFVGQWSDFLCHTLNDSRVSLSATMDEIAH